MTNLYTLEINNSGQVLSVSIPTSNQSYGNLPATGSNITECWDHLSNQVMKGYIQSLFSNPFASEISINPYGIPIQCTGIRHIENKAFLCIKSLKSDSISEDWGFDELPIKDNPVDCKPITLYNTLKRFTENLPLVIFEIFLFPDGRFEFGFVNKEMENFFPLFNREAINIDNSLLFLRVHPEDKQKLLDSIKDVFKLHIWDIEYRVIENGEIRWVKGYGRPEKNKEENKIKVCTYIQDITKGKNLENKLKNEYTLIRTLVDTLPFPVYIKDADARKLICNELDLQLLMQYDSVDEVLGKTDLEIFKDKPDHLGYQHDLRVLKTGRPIVEELEVFYHKHKGRIEVETTKMPILDTNGIVTGIVGFSIDVTNKRKQEEKLRFFEHAFRKSQVPILLIKEDGTYYDYNEAYLKVFGYSDDDIKGSIKHELHGGFDADSWNTYWDKLKKSGGVTFEAKRKKKDGTLLDVELSAQVISYKDIELDCVYVNNLTEKKKAETNLKLTEFTIKNAAWGIAYFTEDGSCINPNLAFAKIYGYDSIEEISDKKVWDFGNGFTYETWKAYWVEVKRLKRKRYIAKRAKKDTTLMDVEINPVYIKFGEFELICAFVNDVTEKVALEKNIKIVDFSFRNADYPMHFFTKNGDIYDFNDAATKLLGYTYDEYRNLTIIDISVRHTFESWEKRFEEIKNGINITHITRLKKKDSSVIFVETRSKVINFEDTELCFTSIIDVTEKLKNEEALKISNERYEYSALATADVIWEWNIKEDSNYFSPNYNTIFGHPINGLEYGNDNIWRRTVHPEDMDRVLEMEARAIKKEFEKWEHVYRIRKSNGEYASVIDRGYAIQDATGEVVRLVGAIQDVTEKKKAIENLRKSNERFENAISATSDVVWECDLVNGLIYFSKNFSILFGHPVEDGMVAIENNIWRNIVSPEDIERIHTKDAYEISKGTDKWTHEYRLRKADGSYAFILDRRKAIKDNNGKVTGLIGSMQDITDRKKAEEEKEMLLLELSNNNKELKQFSYITTHNLRAPLTNLVAICNMINLDKIDDELTKELIEGFKISTYNLNNTLNDLIKVLIIKENTNLSTEKIEFQEMLNKVKSSITMKLMHEGATINADFTNARSVSFSRIYLESIFLNLITNAIKYRDANRKPIIKIKSSINTDGSTNLVFSDNGLGMDMEKVKDKIFGFNKRFHKNADGKGIGLYLVHSQITALGGKIEVDSKENEGTTFTITFK